jgi:hypothetical protein
MWFLLQVRKFLEVKIASLSELSCEVLWFNPPHFLWVYLSQ